MSLHGIEGGESDAKEVTNGASAYHTELRVHRGIDIVHETVHPSSGMPAPSSMHARVRKNKLFPWFPAKGAADKPPRQLHYLYTSGDIEWLASFEVKKTLTSKTRYGDTMSGISFNSVFECVKKFWTQERLERVLLPVIDSKFVASGRVIEWAHTNYCASSPITDNRGNSVGESYVDELKRCQRCVWNESVSRYFPNESPTTVESSTHTVG